ncbi:MAG TPA: VWA domain-containing protein [Thermoanaerobaculia bacterium]|nr:VWA domain-containing protein [Thermoanaerobaculia bacterium]
MRRSAAAIAFLLAAIAAAGQQPYIETFEVRLHNLDVVVTDKSGQPVPGLTRADFIVLEEGVEQSITNFSAYSSGASTSSATTKADEASSSPPPRHYAFFIDDLSLQPGARKLLLENAMTIVRTMRGNDLATVVHPIGEQRVVIEPTSDRTAVEAALTVAIAGAKSRFDAQHTAEFRFLQTEMRSATSEEHADFIRRQYADMVRRRVEQRLGQIRALVASMAGVEGKKIVVLATMALTATPGAEAFDPMSRAIPGGLDQVEGQPPGIGPGATADFREKIDDLARLAASNGVTIYAIEPDVPLTIAAKADMGPTLSARTSIARTSTLDEMLRGSAITLTALTEKTGGRWFRGLPAIDDTFRQVTTDLSVYYSLAYRATGTDDRPRRVEVKVRNRPELLVRTRADVLEKSTSREMADLVVATLLYPRPVNELGIRTSAGKPIRDRGFFKVPVEVSIPLQKLAFLPAANGNYAASFSFHFAASGEKRDFGSGGSQEQKIEITPEQYRDAGQTVYRYRTNIQIAPGHTRIAVGVLDEVSRLSGFRTIEVDAK